MPSYICNYCEERGTHRSFKTRGDLHRHIARTRECRHARRAVLERLSQQDLEVNVQAMEVDGQYPLDQIEDEVALDPPINTHSEGVPEEHHHPGQELHPMPNSQSSRATSHERYVEEVPDEDMLDAGKPFGVSTTIFEKIRDEQEKTGQSRYGPLSSKEIWEATQFIVDCLGQGEADRFLKLACVSSRIMPWSSHMQ
jgi:hypothetical protein